MRSILFLFVAVFIALPITTSAQQTKSTYSIYTADIEHFWQAFDALATAEHYTDSVWIIQTLYLDRATPAFKKFMRKRNLNAAAYVRVIDAYPNFWKTIRPRTESILSEKDAIEELFRKYDSVFPDFKQPDICFAISCLNTGGTVAGDLLLIGSEIVMADSTVDKSELTPWLNSVMDEKSDLLAYLAHETIHIQQHGVPWWEMPHLIKHRSLSLLNTSVLEGTADFLTTTLLDLNINAQLQDYGRTNFDSLYVQFNRSVANDPYYIYDWLYNGNSISNRPADLGYFMGYMIAASYYYKAEQKEQAISDLLKTARYRTISEPFMEMPPHTILELVEQHE